MRRREFIGLVGGTAVTWPLAVRAQQSASVRKIAVLMGAAPSQFGEAYLAAFTGRLEELGWKKDRNARIDVRWWTGAVEPMRVVIADMLATSPDIIMVFSNLALAVVKPMAGNVPIVFVGVGDPIGDGFVASLSRPGGNITGFAGNEGPMGAKWLEVLKETAPHVQRALTIFHPETPIHQAFQRAIEGAAPRLSIEVTPGGVHDAGDIEGAVSSFAPKPDGGIVVLPHAITWANNDLLVALGIRHRLPTVFATAESVAAGGLVSYGPDYAENFRRTAEYVDRILRGEKPSDLPVQQPTNFRLTFNLKTAEAIGVTVPPSLLTRADAVIE